MNYWYLYLYTLLTFHFLLHLYWIPMPSVSQYNVLWYISHTFLSSLHPLHLCLKRLPEVLNSPWIYFLVLVPFLHLRLRCDCCRWLFLFGTELGPLGATFLCWTIYWVPIPFSNLDILSIIRFYTISRLIDSVEVAGWSDWAVWVHLEIITTTPDRSLRIVYTFIIASIDSTLYLAEVN